MAEYIERDQILGYMDLVVIHARGVAGNDSILKKVTGIVENMRDLVAEAPAADVVPVVRCVNCVHFGSEAVAFDAFAPFCLKHMMSVFPDDFCSYGERKGGGSNEG